MGRPCMADGNMLKRVLTDMMSGETKRKAGKKMEGQRQGITRRNWSGLGTCV